jgi:DNA polymerase-3 subunit alpha
MYVFLDTETTGVPSSRDAMPESVRQWPRLVQVAWAAYGEGGSCLTVEAHLVYPTDFAIPAAATRIHGISTARAESEGLALGWVMDRFLRATREHGRILVGHNVGFDRNVIAAEMYRLGYSKASVEMEFGAMRDLCLMRTTATYCRIPGRFGKAKYPTLAELHQKLFGDKPRLCHTAPADVETTARCLPLLGESRPGRCRSWVPSATLPLHGCSGRWSCPAGRAERARAWPGRLSRVSGR